MGAPLHIRLLGGFAIAAAGRQVPEGAWRLRRAKSVVKLLAMAPERRLHREALADVLWPDRSAESAANNLRQAVFVARRALDSVGADGASTLKLRDDVFVLADDWTLTIDVDRFEEAAAAAFTQDAVAATRTAIELYTGELLPEDRYEEWAAARRAALRETHLALLLRLSEQYTEAGNGASAVEVLQRLVVEDPLHEAAHRGLMQQFAADGRQQQALQQYQRLRQALRRELAADPDPETRTVYRQILAGSVENAASDLEPAAGVEDGLPAPPRLPTSLPMQMTSFIGRERELGELCSIVGRTRMLTLTGPGGCGKTRLSLEVARDCAPFVADGVRLVELAPLADPALVAQEIATALGLQLRSQRDPVDVLGELIGDQQVLIVLDNCEHLVTKCAALADHLLHVCPNVILLATSREPLRIGGEVTWRVPSLTLPASGSDPVDEIGRVASVRLFCERAQDVAPGFALTTANVAHVVEICRRLDGMPLALELAAARAAVLSPAQIAERLEDSLALLTAGSRTALTRQGTLRATLEWSHDLLGETERVLLRRLGVFAGSFDLAAVEHVCPGDGLDRAAGVETLLTIAEQSLVQVEAGAGHNRYRLLETVRQYARERLAAAGETEALATRHREWYRAVAAAEDVTLTGESGRPERLEPEHENLRAALVSALEYEPPAALELALTVWWFWMIRGSFAEGARWFAAVLDANPEPSESRARALLAAAMLEMRRGLSVHRSAYAEESVRIRRDLGSRHGVVRSLLFVGDLSGLLQSEVELARDAYHEAGALAEEIGDAGGVAAANIGRGLLAYVAGDADRAVAEIAQGADLLEGIARTDGPVIWVVSVPNVVVPEGPGGVPRSFFEMTYYDSRVVTGPVGAEYARCTIGVVLRTQGRVHEARSTLDDALERFRDLGDLRGTGHALHALGNLARTTGELDLGREWLDEALSVRRELRDRRDTGLTIVSLGLLAARAGDQEETRRRLNEARELFERSEDGPALAGTALNAGCVALDAGDLTHAIELFTASVAMWSEQATQWHSGWAGVMLAEALGAAGETTRARGALGDARAALTHMQDRRGLARATELEEALTAG